MEHPLVSALTILNSTDLLETTLRCFRRQTYPYKELIIVNNAKNQTTASEITISAEPDVFLIDTPELWPAGQARNYAISAANGRILAQFDTDSWHHPNRLEAQIATMVANEAHICVLNKSLSYSMHSQVARYWENKQQAILNTMVYIRPASIDYGQATKYEEFDMLEKMQNSGMQIIAIDKPDLVCKLFYNKNCQNNNIKYEISDEHMQSIKDAIADLP